MPNEPILLKHELIERTAERLGLQTEDLQPVIEAVFEELREAAQHRLMRLSPDRVVFGGRESVQSSENPLKQSPETCDAAEVAAWNLLEHLVIPGLGLSDAECATKPNAQPSAARYIVDRVRLSPQMYYPEVPWCVALGDLMCDLDDDRRAIDDFEAQIHRSLPEDGESGGEGSEEDGDKLREE